MQSSFKEFKRVSTPIITMTINSVPTEEFSTNDSLESKVNAILSNVHEHSFYEEDLYDLLHYKVDPIYKNNGVLRIEPLDADQLLASQKRINDATEMKCLFYIKKALRETPTLNIFQYLHDLKESIS